MVVLVAGFDSVTLKPSFDFHHCVTSDIDGDRLAGLARRKAYRARRKAPHRQSPTHGRGILAPLFVTAQLALVAMLVSPPRVTVKVERRTPGLTFPLALRTPAPQSTGSRHCSPSPLPPGLVSSEGCVER